MKALDRTTIIVLLLLGIALFAATFSSEYDIEPFWGDVSTVFVPRVYFVIWIALSLIFLYQTTGKGTEEEQSQQSISFKRLGIIMVIAAATAIAILKLGFMIGMVPGFFLFCWAFGYHKPISLTCISIVGSTTVWLLFNNVFELPLPRSPWFTLF